MRNKKRSWESPSGLPTQHAIQAAVHVSKIIGSQRAKASDTRESYWRRSLGGVFSPADMQIGEELLIDCGLIKLQGIDLVVSQELRDLFEASAVELTAVICLRSAACVEKMDVTSQELVQELNLLLVDPAFIEKTFNGIGRLFDQSLLKEIGNIGEALVVARSRQELKRLGRDDLALKVNRVSLLDDTAGYDIEAPYISDGQRLFEVKTTTRDTDPLTIYLSRNEAEKGKQSRNWFLIICRVDDLASQSCELLGWTPYESLMESLPTDARDGNWEVAKISISRNILISGIPTAIQ